MKRVKKTYSLDEDVITMISDQAKKEDKQLNEIVEVAVKRYIKNINRYRTEPKITSNGIKYQGGVNFE